MKFVYTFLKGFYRTFLIVISLFLCLSSIEATAQVKQIFEPQNDTSSDIKPKLRIEDNQLFAITADGVYSDNIDQSGNIANNQLLPAELFDTFSHNAVDLVVNGNNALVVTKNSLENINAVFRSEDSGNVWENLSDRNSWPDINAQIKRGNIDKPEELFLMFSVYMYYTDDFGKTWKLKGISEGRSLEIHPLDSKISICYYETVFAVIDNKVFCISHDYGNTWSNIGMFYETNDVAYHYSNPDIMVVIGEPVKVSKDCGKTWETSKKWGGNENKHLFIQKCDFDTRGSNRLYGTRNNTLMYSDNFGSDWTELCQVGEDSSDHIADFVQRESMVYAITGTFRVYQIDLSQIETSVEQIITNKRELTMNVIDNMLYLDSTTTDVRNIEIFDIGGVKVVSQKYSDGGIDISSLSKGIYIARLFTADGNILSTKFNRQ